MGELDRTGTPYNYMLAGWLVNRNHNRGESLIPASPIQSFPHRYALGRYRQGR